MLFVAFKNSSALKPEMHIWVWRGESLILLLFFDDRNQKLILIDFQFGMETMPPLDEAKGKNKTKKNKGDEEVQ